MYRAVRSKGRHTRQDNPTEATNARKHGTNDNQGKIGNQTLPYGSLRAET